MSADFVLSWIVSFAVCGQGFRWSHLSDGSSQPCLNQHVLLFLLHDWRLLLVSLRKRESHNSDSVCCTPASVWHTNAHTHNDSQGPVLSPASPGARQYQNWSFVLWQSDSLWVKPPEAKFIWIIDGSTKSPLLFSLQPQSTASLRKSGLEVWRGRRRRIVHSDCVNWRWKVFFLWSLPVPPQPLTNSPTHQFTDPLTHWLILCCSHVSPMSSGRGPQRELQVAVWRFGHDSTPSRCRDTQLACC